MNAKNLPLKFLFVILLVAVCLWSLLFGRGLRQGIDLRGGHSLVFEIRTHQGEIDRLRRQKAELTEKLQQAQTPEEKAELTEALERLELELRGYQQAGAEQGNLPERMIRVLKQRVDPRGLMSLEWRPIGENRIEIRMPAAKEETLAAKHAYLEALSRLEQNNIRRSDIRRLLKAAREQRPKVFEELVGENRERKVRLAQLLQAYDMMEQARTEFQQAQGTQRSELRKILENATAVYERRLREVQETNISPQELQSILANYVSPAEADAIGSKTEVARRQEVFQKELKRLVDWHPDRAAEINEVVERYKQWAKNRQELEDPSDLKRLIAKAGVLEFRAAPYRPGKSGFAISTVDRDNCFESLAKEGPDGLRRRNARYLWFPLHGKKEKYSDLVVADYGGKSYLLLSNEPEHVMLHQPGPGGWSLSSAYPTFDRTGRRAVGFTFDEAGSRKFAELTGAHINDVVAILLDDEVYSAPKVESVIANQGVITGSFTPQEVASLVRTLEAGSLPARLNPEPVSENTFGPAIGAVNREMGIKAAYTGLIAVAVFMLIYYVLAGFIADVALVLNIIFVLGAMSLLSAVFTLPGIAGVILTIGIAVDANVLIFERLREEQAKNQSVRMALKNAYERAFTAIFDANITTLITCLILGWVGTEEVRGFAITLGLGVMFSLFTALIVTRWVFQLLLDTGVIKKPVFMLHVIGVPKVNWISKRHFFWALSLALVVMGIGSLIWQGADIWGIEFSSGTQATISFNDDALIDGQLPNDGIVREKFIQQARQDGLEKLVATARVETQINPNAVGDFLADHDKDLDGQVTLAEWQGQGLKVAFFKAVDSDGDGKLIRAELEENLPAYAYQVTTTETRVARIRDVAREAFGNALRTRTRHEFELAAAEVIEPLGIEAAPDGKTRISEALWRGADSAYREELQDYDGGLLLVLQNVSPPMTTAALQQGVREMRLQPDFAGRQFGEIAVIGLTPAGEEGFSSFAVLARPTELDFLSDPRAWDAFAEDELALIKATLESEEAMVATNFDAAIAGETAQLAVVALVLSWLAIVAYLWFRFGSVQWGLAAVVCLIHDVAIVVGLVAVSGWLHRTAFGQALGIASFKIDLPMVAAVLTVIGYSVNDTIVVFDRIRENRGKLTTVSPQVINVSVNQTLSRTLLTSGTTFIVVLIMYVWGGPGIHAFNYALLAGIIFGTYSSVAVASPLLMGFRRAMVAKTARLEE